MLFRPPLSDASSSHSTAELEEEEDGEGLSHAMLLRQEAVAAAREDFALETTMAWREARYWEVRLQHTRMHGRVRWNLFDYLCSTHACTCSGEGQDITARLAIACSQRDSQVGYRRMHTYARRRQEAMSCQNLGPVTEAGQLSMEENPWGHDPRVSSVFARPSSLWQCRMAETCIQRRASAVIC